MKSNEEKEKFEELEKEKLEEEQKKNALNVQKVALKATEPEDETKAGEKKTTVHSDDMKFILESYKKKYSTNPGYNEPKLTKGEVELSFSSDVESKKFFTEAAENGNRFIVCDEKKNVIAYSNGDGKVYNPDGVEYGKEETMSSKSPGVNIDKFEMPSSSSLHP